jgi:uncharacterized protein
VIDPSSARARDTHLTLCLTHDCNLRCTYCYGGRKRAAHMSMQTGRQAIALALARTSHRLHLVFFGGEPLLRFRTLVALTEHARSEADRSGVTVQPAVTTNGTLLTEARAQWLQRCGFLVAVSCDGVAEAHDAHRRDRRGASSHSRTVAGISTALAAGLPVRVIVVVDPLNVELLPASVSFLLGLGVQDLVLNPNWSADWSGRALRERWTRAYEGLGALYVQCWREGREVWISTIDTKIQSHIKDGILDGERCDLGRNNLVVAPGGALYPCDRLVGEDAGGPLVLGTVWTGPKTECVRAVAERVCDVPADCVGCAIARRCKNRCACANLAMTGELGKPSDTLCFHEQLAIRVADDAAETLVAEGNDAFVRRHYRRAL